MHMHTHSTHIKRTEFRCNAMSSQQAIGRKECVIIWDEEKDIALVLLRLETGNNQGLMYLMGTDNSVV